MEYVGGLWSLTHAGRLTSPLSRLNLFICSVQDILGTGLQVRFEHPELCRCPCIGEKKQQWLVIFLKLVKAQQQGCVEINQANLEQDGFRNRKAELASY